MMAALVRGRFDVLRGFVRAGKVLGEQQRELKLRQKLLDELEGREPRPAFEPPRLSRPAEPLVSCT
jgi:hypothetical protein